MTEATYYLHIPKTGGTSLISFLNAQYCPARVCPAQLLPELFEIDPAQLAQYQFFRGHLWYGLDSYVGRKLRYLTMLRDPIRRTVSWYMHVRRDAGAYRHRQVVSEAWSLLDFVTDESTSWDLINTQTLFLAVDLDYRQLAADPVGYGQRIVREHAFRRGDRSLLERAKRRLETMDFFGITERMQDSMYLLAHTFDFDPGFPEQHLNVSSERPASEGLSAEAVHAIEERTVLDRELYQWGQALFAERYGQMVRSLVIEHAMRKGNAGRVWRPPLKACSWPVIQLKVLACPQEALANEVFAVQVAIWNGSEEWLSSRLPHPVHVAYHWRDSKSGQTVVYDGQRSPLRGDLRAGTGIIMDAIVKAPPHVGQYVLETRIVQEGVCWAEPADTAQCDVLVAVR